MGISKVLELDGVVVLAYFFRVGFFKVAFILVL